MTTEIELKYLLLPAEFPEVEINVAEKITEVLTEQGYAFKTEQKQLSNYYLDTPELALRKLDMGLRVRGIQLSGKQIHFEQTIKTSGEVIGGLHKRPEYNVDIGDDKVNLSLFPNDIWRKSEANVASLQQAITRLFNTHFNRVTWTITIDGSIIELAFDQGIVSCDGLDKTDAIYEIELELVSGEQQSLLVLAKLLLAHMSMRPGRLSKAARGYALAAHFSQLKKNQGEASAKHKDGLAQVMTIKNAPTKVIPAHEESTLEVIPAKGLDTLTAVFRGGLDFSLTKLQCKVDDYLDNSSLTHLIKINELLALMRQGFWLFSERLTTKQLKIRDELSYFIRSLDWLENAQHQQSLINLSAGYRKKLISSDKLITKLEHEQVQFPKKQDMLKLFHSERFNLLQLSILELLLSDDIEAKVSQNKVQPLMQFAQNKLTLALSNISNELLKLESLSHNDVCSNYIEIHGLLVRSLLTGSWFSTLFNKSESAQQAINYRRPWLDIKEGISELQTLSLLKQQLLDKPNRDNKVLAWLDNKVENLVLAMEQSRLKALSVTPYWQGNY